MTMNATRCHLLELLPIELRQIIYDHAAPSCRTATIGIAVIRNSLVDITYRHAGTGRSQFPHIPTDSEPVFTCQYDASLLSVSAPKTIDSTSATSDRPENFQAGAAYKALQLVNRQIHDELKEHFAVATRRQMDLFVQFPIGLHLLHSDAPELLRRSRTVHIAGSYTPHFFCARHAARLPQLSGKAGMAFQGNVVPNSAKELGRLVRTMFEEPNSSHLFDKLEMRIYFPGRDSYSTIWGDDDSPVVVAMRNIGADRIELKILRGSHGNAALLTAWPTGNDRRSVTLRHDRLEEGGDGLPSQGSCVVSPDWPNSTAEPNPTRSGARTHES